MDDEGPVTRQERREEKQRKRKERIAKHGKNLASLYKSVILKRLNKRK